MSNPPIVWINGELTPADQVRVSPFDLGLTVGLGVFETMVAYDGRVFAYDQHHRRLQQSAKLLELPVPSIEILEKAMSAVIAANHLQARRSRVRISISGGVNPLHGGDVPGNVIVTAVPQPKPALSAALIIGKHSCNESSAMSGVKSASYAYHVLNLRKAIELGADEALVMNSRGILSEASMSNVFIVKHGKVKTPSLTCGCLAGVTRAIVIDLCRHHEIELEEGVIGKAEILDADEIFITSSAREVQAAQMLGGPAPAGGEVTTRLSAAFKEYVREQLGL